MKFEKIALFDDGSDHRSRKQQLIGGPMKHGPLGPNHYASLKVPEYEYQFEQWLIDIPEDYPEVIRLEHPDGRNYYKNFSGTFILNRSAEIPTKPLAAAEGSQHGTSQAWKT